MKYYRLDHDDLPDHTSLYAWCSHNKNIFVLSKDGVNMMLNVRCPDWLVTNESTEDEFFKALSLWHDGLVQDFVESKIFEWEKTGG